MLKKRGLVYLFWLIIYLLLVGLWRWEVRVIWFLLGVSLGFAIYRLDSLMEVFFKEEGEVLGRIKEDFSQKRFLKGWLGLGDLEEAGLDLGGHSVVFQTALALLSFFALSSTKIEFGRGVVVGLFWYSLVWQGRRLLANKQIDEWFWQLPVKVPLVWQKIYWVLMLAIFGVLQGLVL